MRSVYNSLKEQEVDKKPLKERDFQGITDIVANDNREEVKTIKFFSDELKKYDPWKLVEWSHSKEGGWCKTYNPNKKNTIGNLLILEEYRARLKQPNDPIGKHLLSSQKIKNKHKLIVALDCPELSDARALVEKLSDKVGFFKVGMELFFQKGGIAFAKKLKDKGNKIFFDAKSLDIPRTVEAAVRSLSDLNADFMSVHSQSISLLKALAVTPPHARATKLVGITLLTSVGQAELRQLGIRQNAQEVVMSLAKLAMTIGKLDGLVASGQEIATLREKYPDAILIAPGIRPEGTTAQDHKRQDHKRMATPKQAIAAGADHIVVGRPITQAKDPIAVVEKIFEEVELGVGEQVNREYSLKTQ